jgi:hypothetical protein
LKTAFNIGKYPFTRGAAVGAAFGAMQGLQSDQLSMESIALGAFRGIGVSLAASFLGPKIARAAWTDKKGIASFGWEASKLAGKAARFGLEHPLLLGAAVGGVMAAESFAKEKSPLLSGVQMNTVIDQQEAAANELSMSLGHASVFPSASRQRLQNSTAGLTQGLHRGRH